MRTHTHTHTPTHPPTPTSAHQATTDSSALSTLSTHTTIVADTGDISAIKAHAPTDATTNPSLIYKAALLPAYGGMVEEAVERGKTLEGALDWLSCLIGKEVRRKLFGKRLPNAADSLLLSFLARPLLTHVSLLKNLLVLARLAPDLLPRPWLRLHGGRRSPLLLHPLHSHQSPHPHKHLHPTRRAQVPNPNKNRSNMGGHPSLPHLRSAGDKV